MNPADGYTRDPWRDTTHIPAMDVAGPQPGLKPLPRTVDINRVHEGINNMHDLQAIAALNAVVGARSASNTPATSDPLELAHITQLVSLLRDPDSCITQHEADTIADYLVSAYGVTE